MRETPVWFLVWEVPNQELPRSDRLPEGIGYPLQYSWASLVSQTVKNSPAMRETWVRSLGWEYPMEEGMAIHSSILPWRIPMDRRAWWATVRGVAKSWTPLIQHSTVLNINIMNSNFFFFTKWLLIFLIN